MVRRARNARDLIKDRASIHERPNNVDSGSEFGHWEGDLIICKRARPVLMLHERKSRLTLVARPTGKTDAETISVMRGLLRSMRAMVTWFCDAYAFWQTGGVEDANGRLRRWLLRDIDLDVLSDQDIQDIAVTANLTPRKCLGYKTPFQAILAELGKDVQIRFA